jgi:hypothetical protein
LGLTTKTPLRLPDVEHFTVVAADGTLGGVSMKKNYFQKRSAELRAFEAFLLRISNDDHVCLERLRTLDVSALRGDDRDYLEQLKRKASRYLDLKIQSDTMHDGTPETVRVMNEADELNDWLSDQLEVFRKRFGRELNS